MNWLPSSEVLQRRANVGIIVAFLIFIWLPAADTFLHLDLTPVPNENRALAAAPKLTASLAGIQNYVNGVGEYFNDHFGFRNRLIWWERRWKWRLFRDIWLINAIVGKEGWLYFSDGRMMDDIRGTHLFSDAELEAWRTLLTGRRDWLAQRGIRYLFVIPRDKHTIYPEYLPDWLARSARPERRVAQLLAYMREHSDVPILDLRDALLGAKSLGMIYRQTDTHWNQIGGFAAANEIIRTVASLGFPVTPADPAVFRPVPATLPLGDLARMFGESNRFPDGGDLAFSPTAPLPPYQLRADQSILPKKWFAGTDPIISENPAAKVRAVMFRDSFAHSLVPFLGQHFGRIVYVWQQNWDKRIFDTEKPDIVIDEMLERFVIFRDADAIRKNDEQPEVQSLADW